MADFFAKRQEAASGDAGYRLVPSAILEAYPFLGQTLKGEVDAQGKQTRPPFSVTIWAEDGTLRFALTSKGTTEGYFGTIGEGPDVAGGLEGALRDGRVDRKRTAKAPF